MKGNLNSRFLLTTPLTPPGFKMLRLRLHATLNYVILLYWVGVCFPPPFFCFLFCFFVCFFVSLFSFFGGFFPFFRGLLLLITEKLFCFPPIQEWVVGYFFISFIFYFIKFHEERNDNYRCYSLKYWSLELMSHI